MARKLGLALLGICAAAQFAFTSSDAIVSAIRQHNGQPTLFVNSRQMSSLTFFARNAPDTQPFLKGAWWCKAFLGAIAIHEERDGTPPVFPNIAIPCHRSFASETSNSEVCDE